jgi:flagellar basal-body rod protein FlgC
VGMFNSLRINASGLTAQRTRMDVVSQNIANANTTRTDAGGPYRRKEVSFEPLLQSRMEDLAAGIIHQGVRVAGISEDQRPPRMVYDPGHPDADVNGYVAYPNVEIVREMADLITSVRAYEANVTAFNASKNLFLKALEIGRR